MEAFAVVSEVLDAAVAIFRYEEDADALAATMPHYYVARWLVGEDTFSLTTE